MSVSLRSIAPARGGERAFRPSGRVVDLRSSRGEAEAPRPHRMVASLSLRRGAEKGLQARGFDPIRFHQQSSERIIHQHPPRSELFARPLVSHGRFLQLAPRNRGLPRQLHRGRAADAGHDGAMRARRSRASDRAYHHTNSYRAQNGRSHQPGTLLRGRFRRLTGDSIPYRYVRGKADRPFQASSRVRMGPPRFACADLFKRHCGDFLEPSNA
jgi:hypothetical protein